MPALKMRPADYILTTNRSAVTVVIPCFNADRYIAECIDSILSQTVAPLEIIVVDDGSTDDSLKVVEKFGSRVRLIRQPNSGVAAARNTGIQASTQEWIALIDADDVWLPHKLERQLAIADSDVGAIHCGYECFGSLTRRVDARVEFMEPTLSPERLIGDLWINQSTLMFRREYSPLFRIGVTNGEDKIFCCQLAMNMRGRAAFRYVNEVLVRYRKHSGAATAKKGGLARSYCARRDWLLAPDSDLDDAERRSMLRAVEDSAVQFCESALWRRDFETFKELRALLTQHWQRDRPLPSALTRVVYPGWVYRAKDWCDRFRAQAVMSFHQRFQQ